MADALQVFRFSLTDFWEEVVLLVALNLLWSLTVMLPLIPLFTLKDVALVWVLAAGLLLALPLPVVSGALCFFTNQAARGKAVSWQTFVSGVRRYWSKSLIVALINLIVMGLLGTSVLFYSSYLKSSWAILALTIGLFVVVYWLLVQIFWFPMILELENEKIILALRNAVLMVVITPGFSLTLGLIMVVVGALCLALQIPAMLVMASFLMLMANHATRSRLAYAQKHPYRPGLDED